MTKNLITIAGGSLKYAKANHQYLPNFDPEKQKQFILYLDLNALYPTAMSNHLPNGEMDFVTREELEYIQRRGSEFIMSIDDKANEGYFFEVDLSFPEHLHDFFADLSPAPYKRGVEYKELSPLQKEYARVLQVKGRP